VQLSVANAASGAPVQPAAVPDKDTTADATSSAAVAVTLSSFAQIPEVFGDLEINQVSDEAKGVGQSFNDSIDALGHQNDETWCEHSDFNSFEEATHQIEQRSAAASEIRDAQIALLGLDHIEHQWKQLAAAREEISIPRGWRPAGARMIAPQSRPSTAGARAYKYSQKTGPDSLGYSSSSISDMYAPHVRTDFVPHRIQSPTRPSSSPSHLAAPTLRSRMSSSRAKNGDAEAFPSFKEVVHYAFKPCVAAFVCF
jgi:hypothetical protein